MMYLYLLKQEENNDYDTYDSCVVVAANEDDARKIHPCLSIKPERTWWLEDNSYGSWATRLENIEVKCIGTAIPSLKPGVVCASFNAG